MLIIVLKENYSQPNSPMVDGGFFFFHHPERERGGLCRKGTTPTHQQITLLIIPWRRGTLGLYSV